MRIGFIGLGNMGGPMALNVLKAGHTMVVNDLRHELAKPHLALGAVWADTPKAVAQASEVVFTSLPGPREVEAVALGPGGVLEGAARGTIYIDLSTNSATLIRKIHGICAERGVPVLDAPVSGGVPGAKSGKLAVLVGGDETLYRRVKPVLDAIGDKVTWVGAIGCGTVAKLVHNMVSACSRMAIAEGMTLGVKAGVAPEVLLDALSKSSFGQMRVLYVANTRWTQYIHALELDSAGALVRRRIFADMSSDEKDGVPDGMKVDVEGRVYCTGPGGTWVFAPDGRHLGIIRTPEVPANLAFGGPDLRTLFFTARTSVYTLRVRTPGQPHPWYRTRR